MHFGVNGNVCQENNHQNYLTKFKFDSLIGIHVATVCTRWFFKTYQKSNAPKALKA